MKTHFNKNFLSIGVSVRTTKFAARNPEFSGASGFDRKAARNPQPHIVPYVSNNTLKPISHYFIPILLLTSFSLLSSAQNHQVGLDVGYGRTTFEDSRTPLIFPFNKHLHEFIRIGFSYFYTPPDAVFSLKTGLMYDYRGEVKENLKYLKIPMGIDITMGNTFQIILGGGLYSCYLIDYKGIYASEYFDLKNRFQIGVQVNGGFGYRISSKLDLNLVYQNNFDVTTLWEDHKTSPGGSDYTLYEKGYDGFIRVSLKYTINHE